MAIHKLIGLNDEENTWVAAIISTENAGPELPYSAGVALLVERSWLILGSVDQKKEMILDEKHVDKGYLITPKSGRVILTHKQNDQYRVHNVMSQIVFSEKNKCKQNKWKSGFNKKNNEIIQN